MPLQTIPAPLRRELTSHGRVRRELLDSTLDWVTHHGGDRARTAILMAAGPASHHEDWITFDHLILIYRLLSERFASNISTEDLLHDAGRWFARGRAGARDTRTVAGRVSAAISAYRLVQDFDSVTLTSAGAHTVVEHRSSGPVSRLWCSLLGGYYEQTLLSAGAFGVRVSEPTCAARGEQACRFRLRWLQMDWQSAARPSRPAAAPQG